jgi:hypothetical protein
VSKIFKILPIKVGASALYRLTKVIHRNTILREIRHPQSWCTVGASLLVHTGGLHLMVSHTAQ